MKKLVNLISEWLKDNLEMGINLVGEVNAWNSSLDYLNLYLMDEIDCLLESCSPSEILNMSYYGNFRPYEEYFRFNGYGNLESLNQWEAEQEIKEWSIEIAEAIIEVAEHIDIPEELSEIFNSVSVK